MLHPDLWYTKDTDMTNLDKNFYFIHIGSLTCLLTDTVSCLSFGKHVPVSSKGEVLVYLQPGQWYIINLPKIVPTCLIMDMKF